MNVRKMIRYSVMILCIGVVVYLAVPHARGAAETKTITPRQVVERIKKHVTCPWRDQTVDTFKAGSHPDAPITGIATTFMATYDVLQKAVEANCNFIITHEPTFYDHVDNVTMLGTDPIVEAKLAFIKKHDLTVFRFHDHIHSTDPDGIYAGMIESLGWKPYQTDDSMVYFELPQATTLKEFAAKLKAKYGNAPIRVIGQADMKFTKFALSVGAPGSISQMKMLRRDNVEVLVAGETSEWQTVEYARDASKMGMTKALILIGHCNSEQAGMQYCTTWLKTFVPEVPITFIPATDPFWTP